MENVSRFRRLRARTVWISDVHLGFRGCSANMLLDFLHATECETLYLVGDIVDLWALERTGSFKGRYHVLGGHLSALDGIGPEDLNIARLVERAEQGDLKEVILATNLTVDGQTTAHYIAERLAPTGVSVTRLAHGVPVGGELDYLDDGTLTAALRARRSVDG